MSEKISIQLDLDTILNSIENGDGKILAKIIKQLLMADYEIFKQLNQMGAQLGEISKQLIDLIQNDELEIIEEDDKADAIKS